MATAPRRPRSDSTKAIIGAMEAAATPLPPIPTHVKLRDCDLPFWDAIVRARMREEWDQVTLVVAAQLARCQYDIEAESLMLSMESSVIRNDKGTPVANPRVSVLEQLSRRQMALMRSLQLVGTGTGTGQRTPDLAKGRKLQRQAEQARGEVDDGLLAS